MRPDQCRGDDGKHHLIRREGKVRNGGCIISIWFSAYSGQAKEIQSADQATDAFAERQGIANNYPLQTDQSNSDKTQIDS